MNPIARRFFGSTTIRSTPMLDQYRKLKESHKDYLMLFQVGDFYEMFHEDAHQASSLLGLTLTSKSTAGVPMCGIPVDSLDRYVQRLVVTHKQRVAICEQLGKANAKKGIMDRKVVRLVTSGTIMEDSLLDNVGHNNFLLALCLSNMEGEIQLAWTDLSTGRYEAMISNWETLKGDLSRLNPAEVLMAESAGELKTPAQIKLQEAVRQSLPECQVSFRPCDTFKTESPHQYSASSALKLYIEFTQKCQDEQKFEGSLNHLLSREHLMIDSSAWKSLEISQTLHGKYQGSLLHSINRTMTSGGSRLLERHLASPLTDIKSIHTRQACVSFFKDQGRLRKDIRRELQKCSDLERIMQRLKYDRSSPKDVVALALTLERAVSIFGYLSDFSLPKGVQSILSTKSYQNNLLEIADLVFTAIVKTNAPNKLSGNGECINSGFSSDMDNYRNLIKNRVPKDLLEKYRSISGNEKLTIKEAKFGLCVEVRQGSLPLDAAIFIPMHSTKTVNRYTTEALCDLDGTLRTAKEKIEETERKIFADVCRGLMGHSDVITSISESLSEIDVYCSHSHIADTRNYCCPVVNDDCGLTINQGRHPMVEEWLDGSSTNYMRAFVPNSLALNPKFHTERKESAWLITGANMGGKSTFLRQNAHIVIMSQIGGYVPASNAEIGIVDRIYSRVGSSDDIRSDKSTFMVEMEETSAILRNATERSLVLLDEVGRGTSVEEGFAIACAVLEDLCQQRTRTLFATHFHQLAQVANTKKNLGIYRMQVIEEPTGICFSHRVEPGVAQLSHGIHVARLAGVPENVLQRAKSMLSEVSFRLEN